MSDTREALRLIHLALAEINDQLHLLTEQQHEQIQQTKRRLDALDQRVHRLEQSASY